MAQSTQVAVAPIKVGVIADQTGPLSFVGLANANVARMVIDDLNAEGGLLGRPVVLVLEDGATDDAVAAAKAAKLVGRDQVDVVFGGIYSSTRQAIKGPVVVEGETLYVYPEQYEGQESDPLIFCTGPVPAQQVDPLIPWLMRETGATTFYLPSADCPAFVCELNDGPHRAGANDPPLALVNVRNFYSFAINQRGYCANAHRVADAVNIPSQR